MGRRKHIWKATVTSKRYKAIEIIIGEIEIGDTITIPGMADRITMITKDDTYGKLAAIGRFFREATQAGAFKKLPGKKRNTVQYLVQQMPILAPILRMPPKIQKMKTHFKQKPAPDTPKSDKFKDQKLPFPEKVLAKDISAGYLPKNLNYEALGKAIVAELIQARKEYSHISVKLSIVENTLSRTTKELDRQIDLKKEAQGKLDAITVQLNK